MLVDMKWDFPDFYDLLEKNKKRVYMAMAAAMQTNRAMLFDHEGQYNNRERWAPLKWRQGMILSDRGVLRRSIGPKTNGKEPKRETGSIVDFNDQFITIGTKIAYARMMNDGTTKMPGGVLKSPDGKALKLPHPAHSEMKELKRKQKQLPEGDDEILEVTERILELKEILSEADGAEEFKAYVKKHRALAKSQLSPKKAKAMNRAIDEMIKRNTSGKSKSQFKNEKFIFRKSVKIPARNFDSWNNADELELSLTLGNLIVRLLNGK